MATWSLVSGTLLYLILAKNNDEEVFQYMSGMIFGKQRLSGSVSLPATPVSLSLNTFVHLYMLQRQHNKAQVIIDYTAENNSCHHSHIQDFGETEVLNLNYTI